MSQIKVREVAGVPPLRYSKDQVEEIKKKERKVGILMFAVGLAMGAFIFKLFHGA